MNFYKKLFIYFSLLFLCSCSAPRDDSDREELIETAEAGIFKSSEISYDSSVDFYFEKEIPLALYEPEEGVYLGAYVLSNKQMEFEIVNFEKATDKEHSMYMYYTKMGNKFPQDWVLSCIANLKTPYIVISPENESDPFRKGRIIETAKNFSEFYVPVFLEFYPDMREKGYDPDEYIAFYRYVRDIFAKYATNVAFVWSISENDIPDFMDYYPGDDYVDWVGISLYEDIEADGKPHYTEKDIFNKIDYVYYTFHQQKPIIISRLAVSHFSSINHTYYSDDAGKEILKIYNTIGEKYPRIKGINYMDYNAIDSVNQNKGKDNYSVTGSRTVLSYYKEAIENNDFLSGVDFAGGGEEKNQLIKSAFEGYKISDRYFISENSLKYELEMDDSSHSSSFIEIDGKKYMDMELLGYEYTVNNEKGSVVVRVK